MAVLEDCSDDIILDIMSRLHRSETLAALSFACRRLRCLVVHFLDDSKSFRRLPDLCIERSILPVNPIRSLLKRPELSLYVIQAMVYFGDNPSFLPVKLLYSKGCKLSQEEKEEFVERAVDASGLGGWENGKELVKSLIGGNPGSLLTVLLLMLSNLEKLDLRIATGEFWILSVMLNVVSSCPLSSPTSKSGFHALREVRLQHSMHDAVSLDILTPFLLLPSIQKLSVSFIIGGEFSYDGEYGISTVTELIFEYCFIGEEALEEILRIPRALNRFCYVCRSDDLAYANDIVLDIVRRAQPSLDEANILIVQGTLKPWWF